MSASPESFNSTRWKRGADISGGLYRIGSVQEVHGVQAVQEVRFIATRSRFKQVQACSARSPGVQSEPLNPNPLNLVNLVTQNPLNPLNLLNLLNPF
jgi:hypothetical protein